MRLGVLGLVAVSVFLGAMWLIAINEKGDMEFTLDELNSDLTEARRSLEEKKQQIQNLRHNVINLDREIIILRSQVVEHSRSQSDATVSIRGRDDDSDLVNKRTVVERSPEHIGTDKGSVDGWGKNEWMMKLPQPDEDAWVPLDQLEDHWR